VQAVFSWSYQLLGANAARLFRLLSLHAGPHITVRAAASLAAIPPAKARELLRELTRSHLLAEPVPGRYALHDLLRVYAAQQCHTLDRGEDRHAALTRLLDHYLHASYHADRLLYPSRDSIALTPPLDGTLTEVFADRTKALAWFDTHYLVLLAAISQAAEAGFGVHAWQLAWSLATFLDLRGPWNDYVTTQRTAVAAATLLHDRRAQALAHRKLALACTLVRSFQEASAHQETAPQLFSQLDDPLGQAHTYLDISMTCEWQGHLADATRHDQRALALFQAAGHRRGQANALNAVGWHRTLLGDHEQAITYCRRALALHRELADGLGEANTWHSLGHAHRHLSQHAEAMTAYRHALRLISETGERYRQARILADIGDTHDAAGHPRAAREFWQEALAILDGIQHPDADQIRARMGPQGT
jgi:tetratricopeptide (TPR) repeat protein